jgi:inward rectifier potassium channel
MDKQKPKNHPSRLLNRDGALNIHKGTIGSQRLYNYLITASWQRILGFALIAFIVLNIIFSIFYFIFGGVNCLRNFKEYPTFFEEIADIFFFSTQTFTTVGYGHIFPECLAGNIIAALESFTGLMFFAIVTGLFYTKFTQPRVEIHLSDVAIFDTFKDGYGLKFMLTNEYDNKIVDVEVTMDLIKLEIVEGRYKKRFYQLFLFRKRIPFLAVPWTVVHQIDDKSPLKGITQEDIENSKMELFIQIKFFDEAHHRVVFKEFSYFGKEEIMWGHAFVNNQRYTETGALRISQKRFGKSVKLATFPEKL